MGPLGRVTLCLIVSVITLSSAAFPALGQAPGGALQVTVSPAQQPFTTVLNSMVIFATVTSGGQPVPGASVAFNDTFQPTSFHDPTALTNGSGVAVTEMVFIDPNPKNDTIYASATAPGYSPGTGQAVVWVFPLSIQQLAITAAVANNSTSGGSTEVVQGYVGTVYSSATKWNGIITGLGDAKVVLSDGIGSSFPGKTVVTNSAGFYSANFTLGEPSSSALDVLAVSVTASGYNGSESTVEIKVGPYGPRSLTVSLDSIHPSTYSAILNVATLQARVTSGGTPAGGVPVEFSDTLGELFSQTHVITDASGLATTTVTFINEQTGLDLLSARASESGFGPAVASNTLNVRTIESNQLSVSENVGYEAPTAGTTDTVVGTVGWVTNSVSYAWSPLQKGVSGATVTISDTQASFAPITVQTNGQGIYSASFPVPSSVGSPDIIEVTASASGYKGSSSSLFIVPVAAQSPAATVNSSSSSSVSSTASIGSSSTTTPSFSAPASSSETGSSESATSTRSSLPVWVPLVAGGLVVALVLVILLLVWRRNELAAKGASGRSRESAARLSRASHGPSSPSVAGPGVRAGS